MYKDTKTWNPFLGCKYHCIYCKPSFQRVVVWVGRLRNCEKCQSYAPHEHSERLARIPDEKCIFVCGDADVTFAKKGFMQKVFQAMREDTKRGRIWLVQSKNPSCLKRYLKLLPDNTYLLTTLETNIDKDYDKVSKAPEPSKRYRDFLNLKWDKKIVTVEPVMDFDLDLFAKWIKNISPSVVFIGYNSHQKSVPIPEPTWEKTLSLMCSLRSVGIEVLPKLIPKVAYKDFFV